LWLPYLKEVNKLVALPDKPSLVGLIDCEKGNLVDVVNKKFVKSLAGWDGSHTTDGKYGLVAPPSGGMDILDLRSGIATATAIATEKSHSNSNNNINSNSYSSRDSNSNSNSHSQGNSISISNSM
jgi:hypothetical protein